MKPEQLYDLYTNGLGSILNSSMMGTVSDRSYDIHGYNFINRLLIYIQNKYATSLKSGDGWDLIGRKVSTRATKIWVLDNVIKTTYIDSESGEVVENSGLSAGELDKAVRLGVMNRIKEVVGLRCLPIFNIKDTSIIDNEIYRGYVKSEQKKIKLSTLLSVASKSFGVGCSKGSGKSSFNKELNTILIGDDGFEDKVSGIALGILHQIGLDDTLEDFLSEHEANRDDAEKILELSKLFMAESIKSFVCPDYLVESDTFSDIDIIDFERNNGITEYFIQIMAATYDLVEELICRLKPESHTIDESTLRKAAELLTILEANEEYIRLRGGV